MKNFFICCLLMLTLLGLTVANAYTVRRDVVRLRGHAEQNDPQAFCEDFESCKHFLSLTVRQTVLQQLEKTAQEFRAYGEAGDATNCRIAREQLLSLLHDIEDGEKFSFSNII